MLIDKLHKVLYTLHIDPSVCLIDNIHRLPSNAKDRMPVLVKFVSMLERNLVWEVRNMLKDCELKVTICKYFVSVTESNIYMLFPIWRAVMNQKKNARLIQDRLYINNQLYTLDSLEKLHDSIKLHDAAIREHDKHIFFSGQSVLITFHMKMLIIQDNVYVCPELYIQSQKAKLFKCYNTVKQVLEAKSPIQMKNLCKNLSSFDRELWKKEAPRIAKVCLQANFQDPVLKNYLLSTGMKSQIEASPHDKVWGVRFSMHCQQLLQKKEIGVKTCRARSLCK